MKTIKLIAITIGCMLVIQSCGPKKQKGENEMSAGDSIAYKQRLDSTNAANDNAMKEKAREERKRLAAERRAKETYDVSGTTVYNKTDVKPEYKGGKDAMGKYFKDNLKYPGDAQNQGWKGVVYVDFVVGTDGKVQYAEVNDDTDPTTEQPFKDEALRAVMSMPAWTAGSAAGKKVPASFTLPIAFEGVTE